MNIDCLQALLEFHNGVFHAFQCERYKNAVDLHKRMVDAQNWLQEHGLIEVIGDEFFVTSDGRDVMDAAVRNAVQCCLCLG